MDTPVATIGLLLYPGVQMSAALGLTDLFQLATRTASRRDSVSGGFRVCHFRAEADGEPHVVFDCGVAAGEGAPACDVLILPPSLEPPIAPQAASPFVPWLRRRHVDGVVLASVCSGAFVLAETGLLTGRAVTTHWVHAQRMADRFPSVHVDTDRLIIDGGDIVSAGGLMAWIDLGLKLVDRYLGPRVMAETARIMLVDPPGREQRYYSAFVPRLNHGDAAILKAQHRLQASDGREARIAELASEAGPEPRTFIRRFQKATGITAVEYAQRLRVARAQEHLQFGQEPIDAIAWQVGYADPAAFRKVFHRIVGLTPGAYRRMFHAGTSGHSAEHI